MSSIQCDILIIERELYSGEINHIVLPSKDGEMGVYDGHEPMIALLNPGIVRVVETEGAEPVRILVNDGYAAIDKDGVRVVCRRAESVHEIDFLDKQQLHVKIDDYKERLADMADDDPNAEYLRDEIEWANILLEFNA